ncbi:hypothetical protein AB6A40_004263 [Gnathostoma spinigerum]|uniref:SHSP domain-containing protein n=1 Tax=Gnathostoma spinigerum TaxID=75299 RepID=A0ABD6EJM9_9BILA
MSSWWLTPREREIYRHYHPIESMFGRFMDEAIRELDRPFRGVAPYWIEQPMLQECNIGNAVGKVVNDKQKFAVEVNVSQFRPEELSVNVRDNELVVEGHHEERSDQHGSIERHFIRKYTIPEDANAQAIVSHLTDEGILSVSAPKLSVEGPATRNIPIQAAPKTPKADAEKSEEKK